MIRRSFFAAMFSPLLGLIGTKAASVSPNAQESCLRIFKCSADSQWRELPESADSIWRHASAAMRSTSFQL
jgi:hypothetical protein